MKTFLQTYFYTKWPTLTWSAVIFILLAVPSQDFIKEDGFNLFQFDKVIHFILFFLLVLLWSIYNKKGEGIFHFPVFVLAVLATFYGILMEFVQIYTGRDFSIADMIADGLGSFSAATIYHLKNKPR